MTARLLIVGPPGAGKGTQAVSLCERLDIPQISTGALFRAHAKAGDELGQLADSYTSKGELVPDSVTNRMVEDRLEQDDVAGGFLLDGYPRNLDQVDALDAMLDAKGWALDAVIELVVPDEEVVGRLLERATQQGRKDDTADVIAHRIELYHKQTEPLVSVYEERGILVRVDGIGTIEEIGARIDEAIAGKLG